MRNIGLVIAKFLKFATDVRDEEIRLRAKDGWMKVVVEMAHDDGVPIYGVRGIDDIVNNCLDMESISSDDDGEDSNDVKIYSMFSSWGSWDWKKQVSYQSSGYYPLSFRRLMGSSLYGTPNTSASAITIYAC